MLTAMLETPVVEDESLVPLVLATNIDRAASCTCAVDKINRNNESGPGEVKTNTDGV